MRTVTVHTGYMYVFALRAVLVLTGVVQTHRAKRHACEARRPVRHQLFHQKRRRVVHVRNVWREERSALDVVGDIRNYLVLPRMLPGSMRRNMLRARQEKIGPSPRKPAVASGTRSLVFADPHCDACRRRHMGRDQGATDRRRR